jgi:hypothetical protein
MISNGKIYNNNNFAVTLGAEAMSDWTVYRLSENTLKSFAKK